MESKQCDTGLFNVHWPCESHSVKISQWGIRHKHLLKSTILTSLNSGTNGKLITLSKIKYNIVAKRFEKLVYEM